MIFIKAVSVMFIEFIRGVPLITLLFVASTVLNYFLPPGTNFDLVLRVLIMVTLFAAAMAEVVRAVASPPCRAVNMKPPTRSASITGSPCA